MSIRDLLGWGAAIVALWGIAAWLAHRSVFFPMRYPQGYWGEQQSLQAEDVWLNAGGVKLHAWWVEVPGSQTASLFLHGNAGNLSHRGYAIRAITAAGASVLVLDYRGYGKSEGSPSEQGLYQDAEAAYQWLLQRGMRRIVAHGESLGGAVAVELASRHRLAGLLLEAPFSSAGDVAASIVPGLGRVVMWGWMSKWRIHKVQSPLLIIHGTRDEVIPFALGQKLFALAREPKEFWAVEGAGHNDLARQPGYRERLAAFYQRLP